MITQCHWITIFVVLLLVNVVLAIKIISEAADKWITAIESVDWDFIDAKTNYLTHSFHSYPAKFIPQIPNKLINIFSERYNTILDPFCGSGTTLVESILNKRSSIGTDLNPLSILISIVKTTPLNTTSLNKIEEILENITKFVKSNSGSFWEHLETGNEDSSTKNIQKLPGIDLPNRNISKKFTPDMTKKLKIIKSGIDEIDIEDVKNFFLVGFSSTIRTVVESRGKNNVDITTNFVRKIRSMKKVMKKFSDKVNPALNSNLELPRIEYCDGRKLGFIPSETVDFVVTSPPYVNALDYYRVHQYNMAWLGYDWKPFKEREIGCHSRFINNRFRLLSEYLGDMFRSIIEIKRVLKPNRFCSIVIGNSCVEYEVIETNKHFMVMGSKIGLEWQKTLYRQINVGKKYTSRDIGNINEEQIVILKKIDNEIYSYKDEKLVGELVLEQLLEFENHIRNSKGTCLRGKTLSEERIEKNKEKFQEAIKNCQKDIQWKDKHQLNA